MLEIVSHKASKERLGGRRKGHPEPTLKGHALWHLPCIYSPSCSVEPRNPWQTPGTAGTQKDTHRGLLHRCVVSPVSRDVLDHADPRVQGVQQKHSSHVDEKPAMWTCRRHVMHNRSQKHDTMRQREVQQSFEEVVVPVHSIPHRARPKDSEANQNNGCRGIDQVHGEEGKLPGRSTTTAVLRVQGQHGVGGLLGSWADVHLGDETQPVLLALPEPHGAHGSHHEEEGPRQVWKIHQPSRLERIQHQRHCNSGHEIPHAAQEVADRQPPGAGSRPDLPDAICVALQSTANDKPKCTCCRRHPLQSDRPGETELAEARDGVHVEEDGAYGVGQVAEDSPEIAALSKLSPAHDGEGH
mmetsp:Transcript_35901/g.81123  ORF Transcript_35901/g.81123 Transcript_35901/m.81123 type:complete len:355 (+) Transcript_35901:22-1086(+)